MADIEVSEHELDSLTLRLRLLARVSDANRTTRRAMERTANALHDLSIKISNDPECVRGPSACATGEEWRAADVVRLTEVKK